LYRELGARVLARYQVLYKKQKGILEKVQHLYHEYIEWYLNPSAATPQSSSEIKNGRQKWQDLLYDPNCTGPHVVKKRCSLKNFCMFQT